MAYPSNIDTTVQLPTNITPTTPQSNPSHSGQHNYVNAAVVAIETVLNAGSAGNPLIASGSAGPPAYSSILTVVDATGMITLTKSIAGPAMFNVVNANAGANTIAIVRASNGTINANINVAGAAYGGTIGGLANNNSQAMFIADATAGTLYGTAAAGPMYFMTNNVVRMALTSAGLLGIGFAGTGFAPTASGAIIQGSTVLSDGLTYGLYLENRGTPSAINVQRIRLTLSPIALAGSFSLGPWIEGVEEEHTANRMCLDFGTYNTSNANRRMRLDSVGNLMLGTIIPGTGAVGVIGLFNGTEPSTSPIDTVQLFSVDVNGAGTAGLGIRTEEAVAVQVAASTHSLRVKVNGTVYRVLMSNV